MNTKCWFFCFLLFLCFALAGCGTDSTVSSPDNGEPGQPIDYFRPYVGFDSHFRLYDSQGDSVGTSRLYIIDEFITADFSGYIAIDSIPYWMDTLNWLNTFWIVPSADTIFQLDQGNAYSQRQPIVYNRTETDWSRPLPAVGSIGTYDYYTRVFHQRPETETVITTGTDIYTGCGRTDLLAIYETSGDTVSLGTAYFAPNVGRVLSSFRPFVDSKIYYRELIR